MFRCSKNIAHTITLAGNNKLWFPKDWQTESIKDYSFIDVNIWWCTGFKNDKVSKIIKTGKKYKKKNMNQNSLVKV